MTHIISSLKKMDVTFGLKKQLLKRKLHHDNVYEDTWKDKKHEWMDYVRNDELCTAFCYAKYPERMEAFTGFGMRNSSTLPFLGWKYFNSLRVENDETIYTYKDKYMRWFVGQSIKGGGYAALNRYYKSNMAKNVFGITSKALFVLGNIFEIFEAFIKQNCDTRKQIEKQNE